MTAGVGANPGGDVGPGQRVAASTCIDRERRGSRLIALPVRRVGEADNGIVGPGRQAVGVGIDRERHRRRRGRQRAGGRRDIEPCRQSGN